MWVLDLLIPAKDANERCEQISEIFASLRRQIPFLYVSMIVNLIGMHVAIGGHEILSLSSLTVLTMLLLWRGAYWIFLKDPADKLSMAASELPKVAFFTILLCAGFSAWAQYLITQHPALTREIAFFNILSALGATYALTSFPRAALFPLLILGLPVALRLLFSDDSLTRALGLSLLLAVMLFLPLLKRHSQTHANLIGSRMELARERNRAISAEVAALKRANKDQLTGLANRDTLLGEMVKHLSQKRLAESAGVVAICDLDGFKRANDVFGHAAGDALLIAFAERLRDAFGADAFVARMGGDEFAIYWQHGLSREQIDSAGAKICEIGARPVRWEERVLAAGASCGFSQAGPEVRDVAELLRQADAALYMAKASGRGRWQVYDQRALAEDTRRAKLEQNLFSKDAVDELAIEFQPIYCMHSDRIVFIEALARWRSLELGEVRPGEFIALAESLGKIDALNDALLQKALRAFAGLPQDLCMTFNLSGAQISRPGAADHIMTLLKRANVSPARMIFEINESAVIVNREVAKSEIRALQTAGCLVALDDFGAGQASISFLRELGFDLIKFDVTLTRDIATCPKARDIAVSLVNLCHAAGARCLAEHIETIDQLSLLKAMGCDLGQGFHLSRPLEAKDVHGLMAKQVAVS
jgi:diguanylate cyclase (GGDEF)-like protein